MHPCVVLGSGRSGTSLLAGILLDAGYHLGDDLLPPRAANPGGFFEDRAVNRINERLLAPVTPRPLRGPLRRLTPTRVRPGQRWLARLPLPTPIDPSPDSVRAMAERTRRPHLALKDPRFSYTLEAWRPHLPPDTVFLCVFREPGRTAASIVADCRDPEAPYLHDLPMTWRRALRVWECQYDWIVERHRPGGGEWVFVHYDQLFDRAGLDRVAAALDVELDPRRADRSLRRSPDRPVPTATATRYRGLCELAGHHTA